MADSKIILIVEDEDPMARALQLKLGHLGYTVDVAKNGKDALGMLKDKGYDLVILDLIMPKVDGFKVLKELRDTGNEVPVIVASNLSQEEDVKKATELGATGYYIKSNTSISEIVEQVSQYIK